MSDWKPGDVALVTDGNTEWAGIVRPRPSANGELEVVYVKGGFDMVDDLADGYTIRPLVVIDPEDAEQVRALALAIVGKEALTISGAGVKHSALAAALREFANPTPPQPEAPMKVGAIVEARFKVSGAPAERPRRYVLAGDGTWVCIEDGCTGSNGVFWPFLTDVRVLSEGVDQ